ncbi:MAG TPA: phosphoglycerate kinase [Rhodospirillales bacterium]|nr:phosphoglycerate kinase [Rhodospirillales bacterium]
MTAFKTIDDFDVSGKRVLVRADLNAPMRDGAVADATRLERTAPTLLDLAAKGARVVVISHRGRPRGKVAAELTLRPVAPALAAALGGSPVTFVADCVGPEAEGAVAAMEAGDIVLLENLRFHAGEEENDTEFARQLAVLGDLYVNDAFSCAHRAHASVEALARLLPAAAGHLMEAELEALNRALGEPERPLAAVVGGAKVSTKLAVLGNLVLRVDVLVIGGAMANTFLDAQGIGVGRSMCERAMADKARAVLAAAAGEGCDVVLPIDVVVARELREGAASQVVTVGAVPADAMILDIGPASVAETKDRLGACRTVVWNGPLGAFETAPFDAATNALAGAVADLTRAGRLLSVAGGGDTAAALTHAEAAEGFSYISAAGGAFLEWLEGRELPGVATLRGA